LQLLDVALKCFAELATVASRILDELLDVLVEVLSACGNVSAYVFAQCRQRILSGIERFVEVLDRSRLLGG
jgi:hypothetical protein